MNEPSGQLRCCRSDRGLRLVSAALYQLVAAIEDALVDFIFGHDIGDPIAAQNQKLVVLS
jgi:hypothetical protein